MVETSTHIYCNVSTNWVMFEPSILKIIFNWNININLFVLKKKYIFLCKIIIINLKRSYVTIHFKPQNILGWYYLKVGLMAILAWETTYHSLTFESNSYYDLSFITHNMPYTHYDLIFFFFFFEETHYDLIVYHI